MKLPTVTLFHHTQKPITGFVLKQANGGIFSELLPFIFPAEYLQELHEVLDAMLKGEEQGGTMGLPMTVWLKFCLNCDIERSNYSPNNWRGLAEQLGETAQVPNLFPALPTFLPPWHM